ncbi:MAG: hypothetical protein WCQ41_02145 [Bacillota bacterium]
MAIIKRSYGIVVRVLAMVAVLLVIKFVFHLIGFEFISLNPLFTGIIGANVFLLSFLLSGVLTDYKESEKIPGEIASVLITISDEFAAAYSTKKDETFIAGLKGCQKLNSNILSWMYKKISTKEILDEISLSYMELTRLEGLIAPNYIVRLKQENHNLRKLIIRTNTIRETDFISSGYLIAVTTTLFMLVGLLLLKIDPVIESFFFIGVISYVMIFLIVLIRDLDDPFGYSDKGSSEDVEIAPLKDSLVDIDRKLKLS